MPLPLQKILILYYSEVEFNNIDNLSRFLPIAKKTDF